MRRLEAIQEVLIQHAYSSRTAIKFFPQGLLPPNLEELTIISSSWESIVLAWLVYRRIGTVDIYP